jgi:hypothetical protein
MNTTLRVLLGIGVVAVAAVLLVVLKDDGGDDSGDGASTTAARPAAPPPGGQPADTPQAAAPAVPTIVIGEDGRPVGGVAEISVEAGERIRFQVSSPVADEVHVHGYNVEKEVPAGGTATFDFPADIEGLFEVELHHGEEQIAELRVNP